MDSKKKRLKYLSSSALAFVSTENIREFYLMKIHCLQNAWKGYEKLRSRAC